MTDIAEQLWEFASRIESNRLYTRDDAAMLRNAAEQIRSYRSNLANIPPARFDRFFVAALQAIVSRSADDPRHYPQIVRKARELARLCVQAQPGEDS